MVYWHVLGAGWTMHMTRADCFLFSFCTCNAGFGQKGLVVGAKVESATIFL
jgi:hypothetical protein